VVLNLTLVFPLKEKSSQKIALNVVLVVVLVYLPFLSGSMPVKNWKITESLPFLDDLFLKFAMIIEQKSLDVSLDSEKDYENNIYYYILSALLGGRSIYSKIKVNDGEERQLVNNIFKQSSTSSTVPYFVGIAEFLTNVIPLICLSFRLMMKLYSIEYTVAKSVDVELIRHGFSPPSEMTDTDSVDSTNTEIITHNNGHGVIIEEWEKLEAIASNALL